MDKHENELWGAYTEWTARTVFGLTTDRSTFHDARDGDVPVEVKACKRRVGVREDPGKFFIREANHRKLADADGRYVFVVYDPQALSDGPVLNLEMVPARRLDEVAGYAWTSNGPRRGETVIRPPWTALMDESEVREVREDADAAASV